MDEISDQAHGIGPCLHGDCTKCGELLRQLDEAQRLRAMLSRMMEHLPAEHPLTNEASYLL